MTTTDTDALTERLRDRLIETFAQQDPRPEFATVKAVKIAHLVAPIVAAEVRAGKAEAWREGAQAQADTYGGRIDTGPNPYDQETTP